APLLKGADILLAADCVPFAYADFHREFQQNRALLVACPKLDDFGAHLNQLIAILQQTEPRSITVVYMEVPCCSGLVYMARKAIEDSGSDIPLYDVTVSTRGSILSRHDPVPSAST
ncbi:MAG: 4Fe-4S ferredoxin, partial [Dehalococcoidales bacterium]|nr:4Fe-4S ferredoxin [Dehalococcoidales bacterium]